MKVGDKVWVLCEVVEGAVDVVEDVGSFIDDKVIQPIVQDPLSAALT